MFSIGEFTINGRNLIDYSGQLSPKSDGNVYYMRHRDFGHIAFEVTPFPGEETPIEALTGNLANENGVTGFRLLIGILKEMRVLGPAFEGDVAARCFREFDDTYLQVEETELHGFPPPHDGRAFWYVEKGGHVLQTTARRGAWAAAVTLLRVVPDAGINALQGGQILYGIVPPTTASSDSPHLILFGERGGVFEGVIVNQYKNITAVRQAVETGVISVPAVLADPSRLEIWPAGRSISVPLEEAPIHVRADVGDPVMDFLQTQYSISETKFVSKRAGELVIDPFSPSYGAQVVFDADGVIHQRSVPEFARHLRRSMESLDRLIIEVETGEEIDFHTRLSEHFQMVITEEPSTIDQPRALEILRYTRGIWEETLRHLNVDSASPLEAASSGETSVASGINAMSATETESISLAENFELKNSQAAISRRIVWRDLSFDWIANAPRLTIGGFCSGTAMNLGIMGASYGLTHLYESYVNPEASVLERVGVGALPILGVTAYQWIMGESLASIIGGFGPGLVNFMGINRGVSWGLNELGIESGSGYNEALSLIISSGLATASTHGSVLGLSAVGAGVTINGAILSMAGGIGCGLAFAGGVRLGMALDDVGGSVMNFSWFMLTGHNILDSDGTISGLASETGFKITQFVSHLF